jgi:hypothetical protein
MDKKSVCQIACGLLLVVGAGVVAPNCHKPAETVENMPNIIMVGEANVQVTNTAAATVNYTYVPGRG